jgi:hypothetical protein
MPAAMKPAASSRTWPANSRQVTGIQMPFTLRFRPNASGQYSAFLTKSSVMLSSGCTTYATGTENSRIVTPS